MSKRARQIEEHSRISMDMNRRWEEYTRGKSIELDRRKFGDSTSTEEADSPHELRRRNRSEEPSSVESNSLEMKENRTQEETIEEDEEPRRGGEIREDIARDIRNQISSSRNLLVYNQGGKMVIEDQKGGHVRVYTPPKEFRQEMKRNEMEGKKMDSERKKLHKGESQKELQKSKRVYYESGGKIISEDANGENVVVQDSQSDILKDSKIEEEDGKVELESSEEDQSGFMNFFKEIFQQTAWAFY
eukprot:TRINITY_DN856_c0_g1_i2.p2 TRINITY_DN856_c0_g1~~TRINITY_DN856_c0_g1_i2.p2  ORF type:complete len:245 (-),score=71.91 TRINITY_DN856_c0_g1_i2:449-1183(-)